MESEYLLVKKTALPDYLETVLRIKEMIENEDYLISDACKKMGISRSTYYKYKDVVAYPPQSISKRAILSFKVKDVPGVLSSILSKVYDCGANVISINQDAPIQGFAYISSLLNIEKLTLPIDDFVKELKKLDSVKHAEVLGYE